MSRTVLHLSTQKFPLAGGITEVLTNLLPGLSGCGYDSVLAAELLAGERPRPDSYTFAPLERPPDTLGKTSCERQLEFNLEILHSRFNFEMIHAHRAYPAGYAAVLFGRRAKIPVVISCHGQDLIIDPGFRFGDRRNREINQKIKRALRQAEAVVTPSRGLYEIAREIMGETGRLHHIPHGVRLSESRAQVSDNRLSINRRERINDPYILAVGHFTPIKGFDLLFKAFESIADEIDPVKLVVVSGTAGEIYDVFGFSLTDRLKGRVIFKHRRTHRRILELIKGAELLVLPSREEGFALVVLEAMAARTAVVAFEVGAAADLIESGKNGWLVEKGNHRKLAEGIKRLLDHPAQAARLAEEAFITVQSYDWSNIFPRYDRLYRNLLGKCDLQFSDGSKIR